MPELEELYSEIKDNLYKYIMKLSSNSHIAEDIVQETFCRALEHLLISNNELTPSWFYTVAKHLYFDYVKKQTKYIYSDEFDKSDNNIASNPEDTILKFDEAENIKLVLSQLKDNYREVLELREFKELSYDEISKITGMNVMQVKITLHRARSKFKELYKNRFNFI